MAFTLSRNLKLRLDSNLTANAKYNLERLDALAGTFLVDTTDSLDIRSKTDILIEPESADIDGSGVGGNVDFGTSDHSLEAVTVYTDLFDLRSPLSTLDQASTGTRSLVLRYKSDLSGSVDTAANRTLSVDMQGADRSLILGGSLQLVGGSLVLTMSADTSLTLPTTGTVATLAGVETLTNKSIDASANTLTNIRNVSIASDAAIAYSKLNLASSIVNADVSASAAIAYTKLNLASSIVNADISALAGIAYTKLNLASSLVNADISPSAAISYSKLNLLASLVDADISSSAAISGSKITPNFVSQTITGGELRLRNVGGVYSSFAASPSQSSSFSYLLPIASPTANQILRANSADPTQLEWATVSGAGTVTSVALSLPSSIFDVSGSPITTAGTLTATLDVQPATYVFAGPLEGSPDDVPFFRPLNANDIPQLQHGDLLGLGGDDHTLYHTDSRALTWLGTRSTSDLPEGSRLYYTDERAQDSVGSILTDSSSINFTYTDATPEITADVIPGGVNHDQLLNFVANEHIDHSTVDIETASNSGLTGGGDLTATRSLTVDPSNAPSVAPAASDIILFADASNSNALSRTTLGTVISSIASASFAEDWTSGTSHVATHNLGTRDVLVYVYELDSPYQMILVDTVEHTDTNTVTLTSSEAPTGAGRRVLVRKV